MHVDHFNGLCLKYCQLKHIGRFTKRVFSFLNSLEFIGAYKSKQEEETPFEQSAPKRFKGHAIYEIVTNRAVTVYRTVTVYRA